MTSTKDKTKPTDTNESTDETSQPPEDSTEVVTPEFPREINGIVFQTPDELAEYAKTISELQKEVKNILKTSGKVGRPPSQKKVMAEAVSVILNENPSAVLNELLDKLTEDTPIRVMFDTTSQQFISPVVKTVTEGSGTRGGKKLSVDGTEYPSAKNARETLHPDTEGKAQNRAAIITFLKAQGHSVME